MNNITKKLKHLVEVYGMEKYVNEISENDTRPKLLKKAYCAIIPQNNSSKSGQANVEYNEHSFKFIFRLKSIPGIQKDWSFKHDGWTYEVDYWNKDFKNNGYIEVFCKRLEE